MKTKQGMDYMVVNGKYTLDGYDYFKTLEDLEAEIEWQLLWVDGGAYCDGDGWHYVDGDNHSDDYTLQHMAATGYAYKDRWQRWHVQGLDGKHIEAWCSMLEERYPDDEDIPAERFWEVYRSTEITFVEVVGDAVRMYC